ncbi:TetR/AcrR family transcriptional regulator [Alicyclobacillus macrosporangiidus]|uniref:DNA-binding transcriptional regulator, AcrR family n=1 Tax=Alicyclobacillus macrosporangiidus TaxID=392015 RepID=A0A1I7GXQ2_9BACL|nr:TetR/AcrR family transcriptional regulator [Alicyclobacillus macrosporangiidus]SFU53227.1 DNA-binding transcriptional regulator, AcrR family [Alicyclobacillus macrosporangiidus]
MAHTDQKNSTFELILDTTEQLIQEKGCRQTTMQDIIDKSGLSKGAIYHYVSGKDELLGLILKARVEKLNERFYGVARSPANKGIENPLKLIAETVMRDTNPHDVSSKIFVYLLGQTDNPKAASLLQEVYHFTVDTCCKWIEFGQQSGVIPREVETEKLALVFLTFMYGMRVQNTILQSTGKIGVEDVFRVMLRSLQ